jgi:hypothetical protein
LTVTTAAGFGLDVAAGDGLFVFGSGAAPVSITDVNNSTITGANIGLFGVNGNSGNLNISWNGSISGTTSSGLIAFSAAGTGNTTVSVADVTGATNGIDVFHNGTGDVTITTTGQVCGNSIGIEIDNQAVVSAVSTTVSGTVTVTGGGEEGIRP